MTRRDTPKDKGSILETVDVSGVRWRAFGADGEPPIIMNPKASPHALVSWCWAEADHALQLSIAGSVSGEDYELVKINEAIQNLLEGITAVLEALAARGVLKERAKLRMVQKHDPE